MNAQIEDGFNLLDVAITECIVPGMTVGAARVVAECILDLRELRDRLAFVLNLESEAAPEVKHEAL